MSDRSNHIYDLYEHPEAGWRAVRRGFSWEAFLMPHLWAARHYMGWAAITFMVLLTAIFDGVRFTASLGFGPIEQVIFLVAGLGLLGIRPAVDGYLWIGAKLREEGYDPRGSVAASSGRRAIEATVNQAFSPQPIAVAA